MSLLSMQGWPTMSGPGEATLFWVVAAVMVAGAVGVLLFRKAAYAALSMVVVMVGLAVIFFMLEAPFNGAVQIIVYTGAILMLFLFVIMMIGLGATDGYMDQRREYVVGGVIFGIAFAGMFIASVLVSAVPGPGTFDRDPYSNVPVTSLAAELFGEHWMTIQLTAMLLITAAVGAVVLTHSDLLGPKLTQKTVAKARMKAFAQDQHHIGQLPSPGVYATGNAVDHPAIAGDTLDVVEESVPRVLRQRGLEKPLGAVSPGIAESLRLARSDREKSMWGSGVTVEQSKAWGMRGDAAPTGLNQLRAEDLEDDQ